MGRNRKWVLEDSIQDAVWKTILQGPRPPSVRWEKERNQSAAANPKKQFKSKDIVPTRPEARTPKVVPSQPPRSVRQSPPQVRAAAHSKIARLQAAISALGDADMAEKESLVKSLQCAQVQAVVPPVSENHLDAGIHRAGEEEIGCHRGGSSDCCQESG